MGRAFCTVESSAASLYGKPHSKKKRPILERFVQAHCFRQLDEMGISSQPYVVPKFFREVRPVPAVGLILMFVLIAYFSFPELAEEVAGVLKGTGAITAMPVDADRLLVVVESIASSDGRVDVVLILQNLPEAVLLANAIRNLNEDLTFQGVIRARTVPIVIGKYARVFRSDDGEDHFEEQFLPTHVRLPQWTAIADVETHYSWPGAVIGGSHAWRESLLAELEYAGFAVTQTSIGQLEVSHALRRKRRESEILAPEGTPGALRKSQYLILAQDYLEGC